MQWPRTRPARVLTGSRSALIDRAALCPTEQTIGSVADPARTVSILLQPASAAFARSGRRAYDIYIGDDDVAEWMRTERPILDASEMLAGGRGGIDERLMAVCGVAAVHPLIPADRDELKFVGFVPEDDVPQVRAAVFAAGAGRIGAYSECSWSTAGTGTFRGDASTAPAVGAAGTFEQVAEVRCETVVPHHRVAAVTRAFIDAHPYEEPAFDVYQLRTPSAVGRGRVAAHPCTAAGIVAAISTLGVPAERSVSSIGVLPGTPTQAVSTGSEDGSRALLVVSSEPLGRLLSSLLELGTSAVVVCPAAEQVEVALLASRDIDVVVFDMDAAIIAVGPALAAALSRSIGLAVELAEPLEFPSGASHTAESNGEVAGQVVQETAVTEAQPGVWRLNFDGGSRGNPGPAAYGFVLVDPDGNEAARVGQVLGSTTNNVAEYTGLLRGLEHALELGVREIEIRGDSELIVKQVLGQYRVKNAQLKPIYDDVMRLLGTFASHSIRHVYRADNSIADSLVNQALDA
jgi:ribonuclease HI